MSRCIVFSRMQPLVIAAGILLSPVDQTAAQSAAPRFRADGRDAEAFGKAAGYPSCTGAAYVSERRCLIAALSEFD